MPSEMPQFLGLLAPDGVQVVEAHSAVTESVGSAAPESMKAA